MSKQWVPIPAEVIYELSAYMNFQLLPVLCDYGILLMPINIEISSKKDQV